MDPLVTDGFGLEGLSKAFEGVSIEYIVDLYERLRDGGIPLIVEPVVWGLGSPTN